MNAKINKAIMSMRELLIDADLGERLLFFFVFLLMGSGIAFFAWVLVFMTWTFPKVMLPIEIVIFGLWKLYNKILQGEI